MNEKLLKFSTFNFLTNTLHKAFFKQLTILYKSYTLNRKIIIIILKVIMFEVLIAF